MNERFKIEHLTGRSLRDGFLDALELPRIHRDSITGNPILSSDFSVLWMNPHPSRTAPLPIGFSRVSSNKNLPSTWSHEIALLCPAASL
jgi:hypothetical protein